MYHATQYDPTADPADLARDRGLIDAFRTDEAIAEADQLERLAETAESRAEASLALAEWGLA